MQEKDELVTRKGETNIGRQRERERERERVVINLNQHTSGRKFQKKARQ